MPDDDNVLPFPKRVEAMFREAGVFFRCYTLANRTPVKIDNVAQWNDEFVRRIMLARRPGGVDPWRVDETVIGKVTISTVFLGLDHRFVGDGPPILFETMIFGGRLDEFQNRCCTWDEAEAMHAEAVKQVRGGHLKVVK